MYNKVVIDSNVTLSVNVNIRMCIFAHLCSTWTETLV